MDIRDERPGNEAAIAALTTAAFGTLSQSSGTEAAIVAALRDADALTLSLIAEDTDGTIVGHIAFSPVEIDGVPGPWFGLGPVSVAPHRQRQGIGGELIRAGTARLKSLGAELCVLLGHVGYYHRFGFVHDPALTYEGHVTPAFQRLILAGSPPTGRVTYHPGFAAH